MKILIPSKAKIVLNTLHKGGFNAYVVGGCVRDCLLGRKPNDWDITTNATPNEVISLFKHTVPTGLKHGTVTVLIDNIPFEVTTFRTESKYENNRKPLEVFFVNDVKQDLARRDFTVNALAYNDKDGLIDCFDGKKHIEAKLLKAVGDANERFNEDALRMLRAIRFSCQLNFYIEQKTFYAIKINKDLILNISNERIKDELTKMLLSNNPTKGISILNASGILSLILPEVKNYTLTKQLLSRCTFNDSLILKLSCLFQNCDDSLSSLTRLRFDNKTISRVSSILKYNDTILSNVDELMVKYILRDLGPEDFGTLLRFKEIIGAPKHEILKLNRLAQNIIDKKIPLNIKDLNINGKDILSLGVTKGSDVGRILNVLLDHILTNPKDNEKETLISIAKNYL